MAGAAMIRWVGCHWRRKQSWKGRMETLEEMLEVRNYSLQGTVTGIGKHFPQSPGLHRITYARASRTAGQRHCSS